MAEYIVYAPNAYDADVCVLDQATADELRAFLVGYSGYIDDLTIIEGTCVDPDATLAGLDLVRRRGKVAEVNSN